MSLLRRGRRRLDARASANTPDGDKLARAAAEAVKGEPITRKCRKLAEL